MKMIRSFNFWLMAACACLAVNLAQGLTIPAAEDTSSSVGLHQNPVVTSKTGSTALLDAGPGQTAFIRFQAGSYADVIPAITVDKAWLTIYIADVAKAGELKVHAITSDWTEAVNDKQPAPAFNPAEAIATIPAESVVAKQFVLVDVTGLVKNWLTSPDTDFGIAIASDGVAKVQLGSKDGPAKGYAAVLQIEKKSSVNTPEDLRIIRGTVEYKNGALTIIAGEGFSISGPVNLETGGTAGDCNVTFATPFSAQPSITLTFDSTNTTSYTGLHTRNVTNSGFGMMEIATLNGARANFIAIGPR